MSKIKVLTVQFDVTHMTDDEIDELEFAVRVQGEEAVQAGEADAPVLNSGVTRTGY